MAIRYGKFIEKIILIQFLIGYCDPDIVGYGVFGVHEGGSPGFGSAKLFCRPGTHSTGGGLWNVTKSLLQRLF